MKKEIIRVDPLATYLERWKAPTSTVVKHGNTLYVTGAPPYEPETGEIFGGDIRRQAELVLEQLKACVEAGGSSLENVLQLTVYSTSQEYFAPINEVYVKYFPTNWPARKQAQLAVNEFPGHTFQARVVSTAGAVNPTSKRLLTELLAPNPTGALLAGAFIQTTIDIPIDGAGVMIPAMTMLFQSGEPAVALVNPDGKVEIRKVTITYDFGTRLQIADGLSESDRLIINPPPGLVAGTHVTVVKTVELAALE